MLNNAFQQRCNAVGWISPVGTHPALLSRSVERRESRASFGGIKLEHQVKHLFVNFVRCTVLFVYLVRSPQSVSIPSARSAFCGTKTGLGHRSFKGGSTSSRQPSAMFKNALNLSTEVAVACVYQSALILKCSVANGYVLGEDGNPLSRSRSLLSMINSPKCSWSMKVVRRIKVYQPAWSFRGQRGQ